MSVKAFELVPAIGRDKLMQKTQIECMDCCGKNLYIGTDTCFVVHYSVEEKTNPNGRIVFESKKVGHKYLAVRKPIVQVKAASALNRILVLCDNVLTLLNMFDLEPIVTGSKVKGVTSFCINENPTRSSPFDIEICVALKKKSLQIYKVTEDRMSHVKDISLSDQPMTMNMDGPYICVALPAEYKIINFETGEHVELFPYESQFTTPLVKRISKEEFLLSGPSALGMFVTSAGISQRPPLQLSDKLISVTYHNPYVLAMDDEFITVHSMFDQQQKQTISFHSGKSLGEYDGRLFVASTKDVYALVPVHWEKQVQGLLADKKVVEALQLAKNGRQKDMTNEKFQKIYSRIQQQAGFIEFSQQHFDDARQLFKDGKLDVRELISIYPHLMPAHSNFARSPSLHDDIADINQLVKNDKAKLREYKDFLVSFLEDVRKTKDALGVKKDIDTALLKLYAEINSDALPSLFESECSCDLQDCVACLEEYKCWYSLGLLYKYHGDNEKALQIWTKISDGSLVDDKFPGLEFIVNFLSKLSDHELVWKYVDWVLDKDQKLGVKTFTERPSGEVQSERLRPDTVIDYLHRFPEAVITYLEYLVLEKKFEKEKYHTHLAVLYLDAVLQLMKNKDGNKDKIEEARKKLRHMLQISNLFRVQLILGKVRETDMYAECAILYGKLEEHEKALRLLVHKMKDYNAAEEYCVLNSKDREPVYRKRLFQILLGVYLDPTYEKRDNLIQPAVKLLNSNQSDFDITKVLQLIPENWSIGLLEQFLKQALRASLHNSRTTRIERMLARGENLHLKKVTIETQRQHVTMRDERLCAVCSRSFSESTFVRYPNGVVTHVHCAKNKNVCPVTGKLFSTKKS